MGPGTLGYASPKRSFGRRVRCLLERYIRCAMSIRLEPYPPPRPPPQPRPPPPPLPPGDCNWNGGAFEKDCNESPSLPPSPPLAPPEAYPLINIIFFAAGGALVCCLLLGCSYCLFRKEKRRRATLMGKAAPLVKGLDKMLEVDEDEKWRPTAPEEGSAVRRATVEGKHPEPDDFDEEAPLDLEELPPDLPRRTAGAKGRRKPSRSSSAPGPSSVEFGSALRRQSTMPVAPAESYPGGRRKSSVEEEARIDKLGGVRRRRRRRRPSARRHRGAAAGPVDRRAGEGVGGEGGGGEE